MISAPLFGKDSVPQHTSNLLSLIITVVLWLVFGVVMVLVPVKSKPKYKPVQIVLSSVPVEKRVVSQESASTSEKVSEERVSDLVEKNHTENPVIETQTEPVKTEIPEPVIKETPKATPVEKTPVVETPKKVETKTLVEKPKTVSKPSPVQPETPKTEPSPASAVSKQTPAPEEKLVLSKSVDELMAEQLNRKSTPKKEVDWDALFGDSEASETTETASTPQKVQQESTIEGTSGQAAQKNNNPVTSTTAEKAANKTASSSTSSNLKKIKNATSYKSSSGGREGTVKAKTAKDGSGKTLMEMTSGSARSLIEPSEPVIKLSPEAGSMIESTITVEIRFTVLASGNINGITITPEAILPAAVKDEIKSQIAFWRFEASGSSDTAKFEYTIKKQ